MEFDVILRPEVFSLFLEGLWTTLGLLFLSLFFGGLLAVPLAVLRVSERRWVSGPIWLYTYVFRGTPMLIQLYLIYYGIAQLQFVQEHWDTVAVLAPFKNALFCTVLAFALNTCAYTIEMLASAIRETPPGEVEAAQAMGMSRGQTMRRIVLPSAVRRCLPAYSNEVIMMLQGTSVASTVPAMMDLTGAARSVYSDFYLPFEAFITAGLFYLMLTFAFVGVFKWAEHRYLAHLRARTH